MTTKLRIPKKLRTKHHPAMVRVPAWLTRCATMGYELWSDKPEPVEDALGGGFKSLVGWEETSEFGSFYFRLPSIDVIPDKSPLSLHKGKMRRVWLSINLDRRRMTYAEGMQTVEAR